MTAEEQVKILTAERDEEKAIVDRVWAALGISTYEQAKPLAIDEHVKKLIAERDGAINRANIFEQSIKDAAPAYKRLLEERDAALKAGADMRDAIQFTIDSSIQEGPEAIVECIERLENALSPDCGKGYVKGESLRCFKCDDGHTPLYCLNCARDGYHHDDEWRQVVEALKTIRDVACGENQCKTEAMHALAHAEKLISQ